MPNFYKIETDLKKYFQDLGISCQFDTINSDLYLRVNVKTQKLGNIIITFIMQGDRNTVDMHFLFKTINVGFEMYDRLNDFNMRNIYFTAYIGDNNSFNLRRRNIYLNQNKIVEGVDYILSILLDDNIVSMLEPILKTN